MTDRLTRVLAAIDQANGADPNTVETAEGRKPAELVYGQRMSATLARRASNASAHLQIAARGQHIERWTSPRASYPAGRLGYLRWRKDLKDFHAGRLAQIMIEAGYGDDDASRVGALVRKERLRSDAEAQMLEDVVCVVFLEHYLRDFMRKLEPQKLGDVLAKTWRKMSPEGHKLALALDLPPEVPALLEEALARLGHDPEA